MVGFILKKDSGNRPTIRITEDVKTNVHIRTLLEKALAGSGGAHWHSSPAIVD